MFKKKKYNPDKILIGASDQQFGFFPFAILECSTKERTKYDLLWNRFVAERLSETHGHNVYSDKGLLVRDMRDDIYVITEYDRIWGDNEKNDNKRDTYVMATKYFPDFRKFQPNRAIQLVALNSLGELYANNIISIPKLPVYKSSDVHKIYCDLMRRFYLNDFDITPYLDEIKKFDLQYEKGKTNVFKK